MESSENNFALRKLSALVDFSNLINSSLDINFTLNNLLLTCFGKFHTTRGAVFLLNESEQLIYSVSKGIPQEILQKYTKEFSADYKNDKSFFEFLASAGLILEQELVSSNGIKGILFLGNRLLSKDYDEDDINFLKTLSIIGATAIDNSLFVEKLKTVNRELDSKVNQLSSLFDLSKEFGSILDEGKVAKLLMFSLIGQLLVSKFAVITLDNGKPRILETKFEEDILNKALETCPSCEVTQPIMKKDLISKNPLFYDLGVELVVPMQIQNVTKGLILLGKRNTRQEYSASDIEFVYSVGSIAIISIENAHLFQEALEKQKLEKDLEIAKNIQKNLLPREIPILNDFEIAAFNQTARQVGGDYYDIVKLDENRTLIAIGDVSGKGVQAALLMANLQAFLKSICKQNIPLDQASNLINDLVSENTSGGSFITFFWGILDGKTKELSYVNAGHNPPLLVRKGKIIKLKKGGMILGVMETMIPYSMEKVKLEAGDAIITFTDGITEAMDLNDTEYSDERIEELSIKLAERSAGQILDEIILDVRKHTFGAVQSDDITSLIIKVL